MYGVDSWPKLLCATIIYSFGTNFVTFADKHEVLHIYQMGINQKVYFNDETIICKLATLHMNGGDSIYVHSQMYSLNHFKQNADFCQILI